MIGGVGGPKSSKIVGRHSWTFHEHIFHSICLYCHFYCQSLRAERKIVSEFREQNQITNNTEHMKNPDAAATCGQDIMNLHLKKKPKKGNRILRYGCRTFDTFWGFQIFSFGPPHETMKIKVV